MFPLISTVMELRQARMILNDVVEELEEEGVPFCADLPVGMMIEVPSAALMSKTFAREVSFFSIGTNDLIQYTLAVDRGNERVAGLYSGANPAVLQLVKNVVRSARRESIDISVCGELASNPLAVPILVGLGLGELSVVSAAVPVVKEIVRALDTGEVAEDARNALLAASAGEVHRISATRLRTSGLLEHLDIGDWLKEVINLQVTPS